MFVVLRKPGHSKGVPGESQAQDRASMARTRQMSAIYSIGHFRPRSEQIAESAMIRATMPSPIGHALAGLAAAWAVDLIPGHRGRRAAAGGAHHDDVRRRLCDAPSARLARRGRISAAWPAAAVAVQPRVA